MASLRPALAGVLAEATAAHRAPWQAGLIAFIVGRKGNIGLLEVKDTHGEAAERLLRASLPLADEAVMIAQDRCRLDGYTIGLTDWTDDVTGMPMIACRAGSGKTAGLWNGGMVYVAPEDRGRGLGAELALYATVLVDDGGYGSHLYSRAGLAAAISGFMLACQIGTALGYEVEMARAGLDASRLRRRHGLDRDDHVPAPDI